MNKKIIFLLLLLIPLKVFGADITIFSLNEVSASAGNNVNIILNMDNKEEFGVLTAKIYYDNSKLEYVSSELDGLNAMLRGSDKNEDKGIIALYAISLNSKQKMNDNGNIMIVEFKIKEDVTEDIPLKLEIKDFGLDENNKLEYTTKNGLIKIKNNIKTVEKNTTDNLMEKFNEEIKSSGKVEFSSSDEKVATVNEKGMVVFKKNGNVTIEAKDNEGNVIYSKDYYVKEKIKKNYHLKEISIGLIIILIITLIIFRRHKCLKRK